MVNWVDIVGASIGTVGDSVEVGVGRDTLPHYRAPEERVIIGVDIEIEVVIKGVALRIDSAANSRHAPLKRGEGLKQGRGRL